MVIPHVSLGHVRHHLRPKWTAQCLQPCRFGAEKTIGSTSVVKWIHTQYTKEYVSTHTQHSSVAVCRRRASIVRAALTTGVAITTGGRDHLKNDSDVYVGGMEVGGKSDRSKEKPEPPLWAVFVHRCCQQRVLHADDAESNRMIGNALRATATRAATHTFVDRPLLQK